MTYPSDMSPIAHRRRRATGNLICIGSMVLWAAGFPAAETLLKSLDPLGLITARLAMAVAVLIPLWMLVDGPSVLWRARWGRGTWVGGLGFGAGAYLLILAQDLTDPITVAVIASTTPLAGTLIEVARRERRLNTGFILGLTASIVGGVIAVGGTSVEIGLGALAAVISCFLFCWGSDAAIRDFPDLSPLGRTTVTLAGALVTNATVFLVLFLSGAVVAPVITGEMVAPLALYALGAMALSQLLWIASVGRLGVAAASFHINVAPFYVMLILLALGADWSWPQAIGAAVVALGVVLSQWERPARA